MPTRLENRDFVGFPAIQIAGTRSSTLHVIPREFQGSCVSVTREYHLEIGVFPFGAFATGKSSVNITVTDAKASAR